MIDCLIGLDGRADLSDFHSKGCGVRSKDIYNSWAKVESPLVSILQGNPSTVPEAVVSRSIRYSTTEAVELSLAKGTSSQRTCSRNDANEQYKRLPDPLSRAPPPPHFRSPYISILDRGTRDG